jgi:hypothetical protein
LTETEKEQRPLMDPLLDPDDPELLGEFWPLVGKGIDVWLSA